MSKAIVEISKLTKSFKIPLEASSGVKQQLINILKGRKGYRVFTPLKDISFTINEGDFFGIVGRNGSGKSTLLKTIAGIYTPNGGNVKVHGSLVPFIELGVGFNPELTGRENIFLNGALLGFSHEEMESMYSAIVEFAELEDFMEERLKNYSSGMQVRLAFSIAIRAHADILLLDEVLAVGDEAFQKKCYSYFDKLKREKRTVILVTHDMAAVERFCTKAVFIEDGHVKMIGKPYRIAAAYSRSNSQNYDRTTGLNSDNEGTVPFKIVLRGIDGKEKTMYDFEEAMMVDLSWQQKGVKHVGVAIFRENGEYVYGPNTYQEKTSAIKDQSARYTVKLNLNEGRYFIKAGLMGANDTKVIAFIEEGPFFSVQRDYGHGRWGGVTKLDHTWK
ncbi:ABC transporter ATP-binding protein [Candidatus Nanosynsacchari sp. TM7_ANC_38.39_G1_1]|uniref:ABC transporter ATP-binding protein n=1 Tax=Candidatus Nanosynsacchari sp. TM7_ANC_38.39_G1_1 TaxID=1986206 RepID=UPI0013EB12F2|nr:ABC transporter ATP-binding protein [Candidatus Nanosynsacchari sp. TM7_ANC_38.39_G1_1]RYC73418.1 Teichoic acids export ATP-binding protein TagH [Candidatus Nanosynsacchari sp. TM7_ANC_38.39_G1_1]